MSNKKLIPALRFPEFEDEWVDKELGGLGNYIGGGTPTSSIDEYWKGKIPWISSSDLKEETIQEIEISRYISLKAIKKSATKIVPTGSILIVSRVGIGKFAVAQQDLCTSQDFTNLVPKKDNAYFLAYYFKAKSNMFKKYSQGTSIKGFTGRDIRSLKLAIPEILLEQQKIASFLTAVDKRIQLIQQKKEKLEQYKKGVMQKLFSQEIRFKDEKGDDFPDWEEKRLGEIGNTFNGLTGKIKEDFGEGKPYIQYKQVFDKHNIDTSKFGLVRIEENEKQKNISFGDVFFTTSSETREEVGTASVLLTQVQEVYLNSFCFGFRPNSFKELSPYFAQYFFRSEIIRKEIIKLGQGSTRFNMSKVEFMKLRFYFPILNEQQKIASFLSVLDKKIEQVDKQVEGTQLWKKGLLQQMFVDARSKHEQPEPQTSEEVA